MFVERKCPKCDSPIRDWDKCVGGACLNCKHRARLGDRDDERVVVAPAMPAQLVEPSPPEQTETRPAAVSAPAVPLLPQPCRCGNSHKVTRNGAFTGWCKKCVENGRGKLLRRGDSPTPQALVAFLEAGPLRVDTPPRKPRTSSPKRPAATRPARSPSIPSGPVEYPLRYCVPAWVFSTRRLVNRSGWQFGLGVEYVEPARTAA